MTGLGAWIGPAACRFAGLGLMLMAAAPAMGAAASPSTPSAVKPAERAAAPPSDCTQSTDANATQGATSSVVVELDPDTLWRPRGSEVRFTFSGSGLVVLSVRVCFGWSRGMSAGAADDSPKPLYAPIPSPLVRPVSNPAGQIEYAARVPELKWAPGSWPFRAFGRPELGYMALGIVPLSDMQVVAEVLVAGARVPVAVILPVGVTSVWHASIVVIVLVSAVCCFLWWVLGQTKVPGVDPVLRVITAADGYASLSQFQIMLWTLLVGAAAIYVMVLSGNLIGITSGTLTLLGIAATTTVLARVPGAGAPQTIIPKPTPPAWSDLIVSDYQQGVDVTRVQMMIFTVVSAGFVALKVIVSYEIPVIPENYLLLMGISNGVYIAGKSFREPRGSGKIPADS